MIKSLNTIAATRLLTPKTVNNNKPIQIAKCDSVSFSGAKVLDSKLSDKQNRALIDTVKTLENILNNNAGDKDELTSAGFCELGSGVAGKAFKARIPGIDEDVAIKVSYADKNERGVGAYSSPNHTFEDEADNLKQIPDDLKKNCQSFIAHIKGINRYYLISTFAQGTKVDPKKENLSKEILESLLPTLAELDVQGIMHNDLKRDNWLVGNNNNVTVIDFGAMSKHKFEDNPSSSNITNFENGAFCSYLTKFSKNKSNAEVRELFNQYLQVKSNFYEVRVSKMEELLKTSNLNEQQTENIKKEIENEKILAKMLKNPTEKIIDLEATKLQVNYASHKAATLEDFLGDIVGSAISKLKIMFTVRDFNKTCDKLIIDNAENADMVKYLAISKEMIDSNLDKLFEFKKVKMDEVRFPADIGQTIRNGKK